VKDARYWHERLSKLIGKKLDSVACVDEEIDSIVTKEKLTKEELAEIEKATGKTVFSSEDPYAPPYVYTLG